MVKLKVYVRVIPESAYGADAATAPPRKFVVVVRDPAEWFIGTLAREAQRTYQRLYRHDLGKVKYLKDGDDNDLDPEQYVSDIFVNEGKAARDGLDQEAVIKIIQEQGQTVRAGSVVPDLTPAHYSHAPSSRLPGISSSLGKRSHAAISGSQEIGPGKRSRLVEIPESQEVVPSVERSPEPIQSTQRDAVEDDVFDDAKEYHPSHEPERVAAATSKLPPVTPSTNALTNGTTATKSPVQHGSSSASKFKVGNHRDVYALPESDIEDSQMSNVQPIVLTNGIKTLEFADRKSRQPEELPKAVAEFDAQEALYPMELDEPPSAVAQKSSYLSRPSQKKDVAAPSESESSNSNSEDSDQEPGKLEISKSRQQTAMAREYTPVNSLQTKRQKTPSLVDGITQKEKTQIQKAKGPASPISTNKSTKQKRSDSLSKSQQLKPALPLSPSRRASGVVSELDSPGEQLSQGLRDSAKDRGLAEGVRAVLAGKQGKKKQRLMEKREQNKSQSSSSSVVNSRPASREGPAPKKTAKKKSQTRVQLEEKAEQQDQKQTQSTTHTDTTQSDTVKPGQGTKSKSLKDKLADASAKAVTETAKATTKPRKDKHNPGSDDASGSDDEGAPLPSIENTPIAPAKAISTLPLPGWGSGSRDPKDAAVRASPAFIIPVGMKEEEYIRLRAQNELTPQLPKIAPATKRKASTPAASAKTPRTGARETVSMGKKIVERATELAKTVAKKTVVEDLSSDEESSSFSGESDDAADNKREGNGHKMSLSSNASSKPTSPVEVRKIQTANSSKTNGPASMPPPTPKSTAKRRESMNKQRVERSSSSVSTQMSSSEQQKTSNPSSSSSSSSAPTKAKVQAQTKPTAAQPKKATAPPKQPTRAAVASPAPATKTVRPAVPMIRESALKALRAKINSEAASPAPSLSSARAKKVAVIQVDSSSSSSEEESSSDESSEDEKKGAKKKQSLGKAKINTPLKVEKPDPSIRDPSPDESRSSEGSDDD